MEGGGAAADLHKNMIGFGFVEIEEIVSFVCSSVCWWCVRGGMLSLLVYVFLYDLSYGSIRA